MPTVMVCPRSEILSQALTEGPAVSFVAIQSASELFSTCRRQECSATNHVEYTTTLGPVQGQTHIHWQGSQQLFFYNVFFSSPLDNAHPGRSIIFHLSMCDTILLLYTLLKYKQQ